jgi:F-type H+-transporting ATPase subunit b
VEQILKSLNVEIPVLIAQLTSFVVLIFVLIKFLYRPIENILQQRADSISGNLTAAEEERKKADFYRQQYEEQLANVADEARLKLEQAVKDAEQTRERMIADVKAEIKEIQERSQEQLNQDREKLRYEIRTEMAEIAVGAAKRALRGNMTKQLSSDIYDSIITEIGNTDKVN